jgi:hypothetical protein
MSGHKILVERLDTDGTHCLGCSENPTPTPAKLAIMCRSNTLYLCRDCAKKLRTLLDNPALTAESNGDDWGGSGGEFHGPRSV